MSVAVACLTPLNSAAQARTTGTVAGCITDTTGQPLPGVTVDVGGNGRHRIVQSDASGCYAVPDVSSGSHFVFARLQGFVSMTRDNLNVEPGRSQTIDLQMRIAPMCECIALPRTLSALWDEADAVVRVRIIERDSSHPEPGHRAALLGVWKRPPTLNTSETLTFVRHAEPNEVEPYAAGQDFVVFLKWSPAQQVFVRMSGGEGTVGAFAVENGRIHSGPIAGYAGMEAGQLVNELASFATR
jgi:hypothetical protein